MRKIIVFVLIFNSFFSFAQDNQKKMKPADTEFWEPKVTVVKPGTNNSAPSDAIVLFDGTGLSQWVQAKDSTAAN